MDPTSTLKLGPSEVTVIGLLAFAILTGWMGQWMFRRQHEAGLAAKDGVIADRDRTIVKLEAELKHEREVVVVHWQEMALRLLETGERNATVNERLVDRLTPPPAGSGR